MEGKENIYICEVQKYIKNLSVNHGTLDVTGR